MTCIVAISDQPNEQMIKTYWFGDINIFFQKRLICVIVYEVSRAGTKIGVFKSAVLQFKLKAGIDTQEQCVFPSYNDDNNSEG